MTNDADESTRGLVKRIFLLQVLLIAVTGVLFLVAVYTDLGFFWFAFLAGIFGASIALLRRVQAGDTDLTEATVRSWSATLMPFLYGGMMAAVAYFLFVSQVLSGQEGQGLLATNLFPDFNYFKVDREGLSVKDWWKLRPKGLADAGKLMIWCFLAGYSESFVTGMLKRLEQNTGEN